MTSQYSLHKLSGLLEARGASLSAPPLQLTGALDLLKYRTPVSFDLMNFHLFLL